MRIKGKAAAPGHSSPNLLPILMHRLTGIPLASLFSATRFIGADMGPEECEVPTLSRGQ